MFALLVSLYLALALYLRAAIMSFTLPEGMPRYTHTFDSISESLDRIPSLSGDLLSSTKNYLSELKEGKIVFPPPTAQQLAMEQCRFDAREASIKVIAAKHGLDPSLSDRYRRPSGSVTAGAASDLFWPPATSRHGSRYTLVMGPDTTTRMLKQGCDTSMYTMDLYPFVTPIDRKKAFTNQAFTHDKTLTPGAARDLWAALSADAREDYCTRAILPGVDVVNGAPVKDEYEKAIKGLKDGWKTLPFKASIAIPGIKTDVGEHPAGDHPFTGLIFYRCSTNGSIRFGKLVIFTCHPCATGAKLAQGSYVGAKDWRNNVFLVSF